MNPEKLNTEENSPQRQKILDAYSKIAKFLRGFESNAPIGRVDDAGNYDEGYEDVKDSQDQINDMMQNMKNIMDASSDDVDYLQKVCKKAQLYEGRIPNALIGFVKKEFGVEVALRTEDEIKKTEYESRLSLVPLMYHVTLDKVKKLIPYKKYCDENMTNKDIYRIISANFRERSES